MAKVRYHVGPQGPGICRVDLSNPRSKGCPFGGESGSENHFATMAEAESAYAEKMEASGNGLVASSSTSTKIGKLQTELKAAYRKRFDNLVADSYYGVSTDAKGNLVADSSEGLKRFTDGFAASVSHEVDPEIDYEDYDAGIIRSVYIEELDISIENQNLKDDLDELADARAMAGVAESYWRE